MDVPIKVIDGKIDNSEGPTNIQVITRNAATLDNQGRYSFNSNIATKEGGETHGDTTTRELNDQSARPFVPVVK